MRYPAVALTGPLRFALAAVATLLLFLVPATSADAKASVWRVSNGEHTLYLGGTVHFLRRSDYPLPEAYEQAYAASSELYFETDISAINGMSVQAQMLQELTYSDGRTLKSVLNEEAYAALDAYTASLGVPLSMFEQFKPGMIAVTFQVMEFQRLGFTPQGVDTFFTTRAVGDAKAIGALETIEEQIAFLAAMGEGNESDFILWSLQDFENTAALMDEMIAAWRSGDSGTLQALVVDEMKANAPALYNSLLRERNLRWIPQIESMLEDPDTELVLVGSAHLIGNEGLVSLLRKRGYAVSQL